MARTPVAFRTCFETACYVANGSVPVAGSTDETQKLIDFNRTYAVGYKEGGLLGWTDARVGSSITPASRLISFDTIGDGRLWEVWSEDPRAVDNDATRLDYTENAAGILLNDDVESPGTVWMSWIPESMKFGNTAWVGTTHDYAVGDRVVHNDSTATTHNSCYKCIVAHNSTDYATFALALAAGAWLLLPVLSILEEFVYAHMQGAYLIRNGSPETGFAMQANAIAAVEKLARDEANNRSRN